MILLMVFVMSGSKKEEEDTDCSRTSLSLGRDQHRKPATWTSRC